MCLMLAAWSVDGKDFLEYARLLEGCRVSQAAVFIHFTECAAEQIQMFNLPIVCREGIAPTKDQSAVCTEVSSYPRIHD